MNKNISKVERMIRVAAGISVASLAFIGPGDSIYLTGLLITVSGLVGFCPFYYALGIKTCCCDSK